MAFLDIGTVFAERLVRRDWGGAAAQSLFALIVACLLYGALVYQITRLLHLRRRDGHQPATEAQLRDFRDPGLPTLTILVPSYREEPRVVMQTLLSAALQSYDSHRVVLLIDDPPSPRREDDATQLRCIRVLAGELHCLLEGEARHFKAAREAFEFRHANGALNVDMEAPRLAALFERASDWFADQATKCNRSDHAEAAFHDKVLLPRRDALLAQARRLGTCPPELSATDMARGYRQLEQQFSVELSSFERKRYVNLSHEANKAMNLNSYIALMGERWRETRGPDGLSLERVERGPFDLAVPESSYIITLDADSLLVPDYALRLVEIAERPGRERLAVVQTPYSAFPGATAPLERIAGATTDIQYNIHQGFTGWNSTYWVGANALLRKTALDDIAEVVTERGYAVTVYIQDRTVIEDTESTVDLIANGWRLFNYPERLAYSATPPDFGSLVIQRRRWANGGLIILPKLLRYLLREKKSFEKLGEAFFRIHYLVSIAAVNICLILMLSIPFTGSVTTWWLPLTALPYFCLYARDLQLAEYRTSDLVRVYALNLVLIPVNLGGVLTSLKQAWARHKIPFWRTPKVKNRTPVAPIYVGALYFLMSQWLVQAGVDFTNALWVHGAFTAANAALLLYGTLVFVGFRHSWEDLMAPYRRRTAEVARLVAVDAARHRPEPNTETLEGVSRSVTSSDPEIEAGKFSSESA